MCHLILLSWQCCRGQISAPGEGWENTSNLSRAAWLVCGTSGSHLDLSVFSSKSPSAAVNYYLLCPFRYQALGKLTLTLSPFIPSTHFMRYSNLLFPFFRWGNGFEIFKWLAQDNLGSMMEPGLPPTPGIAVLRALLWTTLLLPYARKLIHKYRCNSGNSWFEINKCALVLSPHFYMKLAPAVWET